MRKLQAASLLSKETMTSYKTEAIAGLLVLRDSMMSGNWHDDRQPKSAPWMETMKAKAKEILARFPDPLPPYTEIGS